MYEGQVTGACVSLYLSLTPVMVIEWVGDAPSVLRPRWHQGPN